MDRRSARRPAGGHRPQNNLHSSHSPTLSFGAHQIDATANDSSRTVESGYKNIGGLGNSRIFSFGREQGSLPPSFEFTGYNQTRLSQLGDSSSLFSVQSPRSPELSQQARQAFQFGTPTPESNHEFTFDSSPLQSSSEVVRTDLSQLHSSVSSFVNSLSENMVVEREPPKTQLSPSKTDHHTQHRVIGPEFGKATSLQSPLRPSVFNIPKANKARPEHHRVVPASHPHDQQANHLGREFINPFQQQPSYSSGLVHVVPDDDDDDDVQIIAQPSNPQTWASYPARPATYSSLVKSVGGFASSQPKATKLDRFMDLTDTALFEDKFGAADPYEFVDAVKANENIKALLEGAFEDEEDKPKTRGRKKKLEANAAGLLEKLQGLSVAAEETKKEPEQEEDEDEEDEEDGSVEGLKVKLLPHQVAGVDWMRDKEAGLKKKNMILPKGGILADDVGRPSAGY